MGQKYFSTLPPWRTPEKLTYSWKNIQPTVPILALEKSQLKNSSLDHTCRRYSELQRLKPPQSPKVKNPLSFSNNVQYLPLTELTSGNISTHCNPTFFLPRSPFEQSTKNPLPPLNFSPHLLHIISHWAMITMRKYVSADDTMQILHSYHWVLSRNNLGELQKLRSPSVLTFDTRLTDSKFRNFPPLLFRPPRQNRLAKKPSWAVRHNLNKNWAKPAKNMEIFCWRLS